MQHTRSLLRVALRLTSDANAAEDLVQETMLLAWRNFRQLRDPSFARPWLFRILFNAFYAQGRKQRAMPSAVSLSAGIEGHMEPATGFSALDAAEISQALDTLHEDHRTVLLLCVVEGFTAREAAGILDLPMGTVMSRLSRAREALRARLAPSTACAEKEV